MYIDFSLLPDHSRIWIYQADRQFSPSEEEVVRATVQFFCDQWVAHGEPLKTSFKIEYQQFLILAVDEAHHGASGCSIDGSVHMLKSLQQTVGIDFFDRSRIAFLMEGRVTLIPTTDLKKAFASGTLQSQTPTFNSLVMTKRDWERNWVESADKTWLQRYIPKAPVA